MFKNLPFHNEFNLLCLSIFYGSQIWIDGAKFQNFIETKPYLMLLFRNVLIIFTSLLWMAKQKN